MNPEFENIELKNNEAENRFEMNFDNHLSLIEYEISDKLIALLHTEVDAALEGRGRCYTGRTRRRQSHCRKNIEIY